MAVIVVAFSVLATVTGDRILGFFVPYWPPPSGLVFPPHSEAFYETTEFTFNGLINSLGFRDREFTVKKSADVRLLAIGDSFTYGWGVDAEQAWPKVLERNLHAAGVDAEVANLGMPGGSPVDYASIAARAIPALHPDIVIVAVLQGDDLAQLDHVKMEQLVDSSTPPAGLRSRVTSALRALYPNIIGFGFTVRSALHPPAREIIAEKNLRQAEGLIKQFNKDERARYDALEPRIRQAFTEGKLNPALINLAVKYPYYFSDHSDSQSPDGTPVRILANRLARINQVADQNDARVEIVSVPFGIYVNERAYSSWTRYGFTMEPDILVSTVFDDAIRTAANRAGLELSTVTATFRNERDHDLFYVLDGHFNAAGHRAYADALAPAVIREIQRLHRNGHFTGG